MIIETRHIDGPETYIVSAKSYDFYPETKMLYVDCDDDQSFYIPLNENVKYVRIEGGTERGYLEGHDEAR